MTQHDRDMDKTRIIMKLGQLSYNELVEVEWRVNRMGMGPSKRPEIKEEIEEYIIIDLGEDIPF